MLSRKTTILWTAGAIARGAAAILVRRGGLQLSS
jgi:hypothetical protein